MVPGDDTLVKARLQLEAGAGQVPNPGDVWELGSLQQQGALQLSVLELEGRMDAIGREVWLYAVYIAHS